MDEIDKQISGLSLNAALLPNKNNNPFLELVKSTDDFITFLYKPYNKIYIWDRNRKKWVQ
jgi:hypothetical protein